jgi:hypothetical protein
VHGALHAFKSDDLPEIPRAEGVLADIAAEI